MLFEQSIANYLSFQPYEYSNTEIAEDGKHRLLHLKSSKETEDVQCPYCKGHVHILSSCSMRLRDMPLYSGTRQDLEISYHRYRCQSCARTFCEEIPFRYPETRDSVFHFQIIHNSFEGCQQATNMLAQHLWSAHFP